MKLYDKIRVINDCKYYNDNGVFKGRLGRINSAEIRDNCFEVIFIDERFFDKSYNWTDENLLTIKEDILLEMNIEDMEVVEPSNSTDQDILDELPKNDPRWWCKVENGYIMNLLGDKKNKIPYDYKS